MTSEADALDVDILIVGAGPVGLMGGILAARQGLSALVVERRDGPQTAPAAHVVNARTYEICRQAGLDVERIRDAAQDPTDAGHVNFLGRLSGPLIGRLPFERQGPENLSLTPTPLRNLSQHRFEPLLVDGLRASVGSELRYGHQWESSTTDAEGVTSVIVDRSNGSSIVVRSRYVIGCDGAGSRIRQSIGIEMHGPPLIQCFLMVHFGAAEMRRHIAGRPGVLHFTLDPEAGGAFVAHDIDGDWVFMHGIDPEHETVDDYTDDRCREVIDAAAGTTLDATIIGKGTWWMSAQTANGMQRDRIFLAGDAAHRFPPTGGMGLNSGMADIHGLMWRLGAVESGWGSGDLLATYEAERLPVARENSRQSLTNAFKIVHLAEALGIAAEPTSARLQASIDDPTKADEIAAAVELQREHFDMVRLHLGYVYGEGALVSEGPVDTPESPSVFIPSARPGARLPHAWIDHVDGRSTLDLIDRSALTLLTFGQHDTWLEAAGETVPLAQVRIGIDTPALDDWRELCELEADGALLVRPDQHVAWRAAAADGADALLTVIAQVVGAP